MRQPTGDPVSLSGSFLSAVKTGDAYEPARREIARLSPATLRRELVGDDAKRAFWLNVYNAFAQSILDERPGLWKKKPFVPVRPIFTDDLCTVAGHELSLNDIEHGILRRSKSVLGLGYVPRLRPDSFERTHRVDRLDPRIHFALNCGAASCPPIAVYTADGIDDELELATNSYLQGECSYDPDANVVTVPKLFSWYRGDFGGTAGILECLKRYDVLPAAARPSVTYDDYDWSMKLGNFDAITV
jgi:hypothetical protein